MSLVKRGGALLKGTGTALTTEENCCCVNCTTLGFAVRTYFTICCAEEDEEGCIPDRVIPEDHHCYPPDEPEILPCVEPGEYVGELRVTYYELLHQSVLLRHDEVGNPVFSAARLYGHQGGGCPDPSDLSEPEWVLLESPFVRRRDDEGNDRVDVCQLDCNEFLWSCFALEAYDPGTGEVVSVCTASVAHEDEAMCEELPCDPTISVDVLVDCGDFSGVTVTFTVEGAESCDSGVWRMTIGDGGGGSYIFEGTGNAAAVEMACDGMMVGGADSLIEWWCESEEGFCAGRSAVRSFIVEI